MSDLKGLRVAVIATDGFEESELTEPVRALRDAGAQVEILAPADTQTPGEIQAFHHHDKTIKIRVDRTLGDRVKADQYDALLLPGGALSADRLRIDPDVR